MVHEIGNSDRSNNNELKKIFESFGRSEKLLRGEVVYRSGDRPQGLYYLASGLISLVLTGEASGNDHFVRFFRPGQFFGHRALFSNEPYHATAQVIEASTLLFISREQADREFSEQPRLYKTIAQALAVELRRSELQRVMILENQILARVAQTLVYLKELDPNHSWTRQEISNVISSTVSTVIKALGELEKRGLIKQEGRGIAIVDRDGLLSVPETARF
jgi:CRP-like cAMP-binding protein